MDSSPFYIGDEYSQILTKNDHLYNIVYKLTPEELSKIARNNVLKWVKQRKDYSVKTEKELS